MLYSKFRSGPNDVYAKVKTVICHKQTDHTEILVADLLGYGKTLVMDNEMQTCELDYFAYHDALMIPHKAKDGEKCLILGSGEGVSVDMAVKSNYEVTALDIDPQAVAIMKSCLGDWNNMAYDHPKVKIVYSDCNEYLKTLPDKSISYVVYDLDTSRAIERSEEAMKEIYRILLPNGVLSLQDGPIYSIPVISEQAKKHFKNPPVIKQILSWRFAHYVKGKEE